MFKLELNVSPDVNLFLLVSKRNKISTLRVERQSYAPKPHENTHIAATKKNLM